MSNNIIPIEPIVIDFEQLPLGYWGRSSEVPNVRTSGATALDAMRKAAATSLRKLADDIERGDRSVFGEMMPDPILFVRPRWAREWIFELHERRR